MSTSDLDIFVENHLNLQVKISYEKHHDFLLRHKLNDCSRVLDVGTGNGTFVARLAQDHPGIHFSGIDKRKHCIKSAQMYQQANLDFSPLDMFSREGTFDFSQFDGFLMRYFLLHVDNSQKIMELLKQKAKRPSRFWIIDLDWSALTCVPHSPVFSKLQKLVKDFCAKISVDTMGGQRVVPMLQSLEFKNIEVENIPFSTETIALDDLALYIKQEIQCYSHMSGRSVNDPDTREIVQFIDEDVRSGRFEISYGMILVTTELL